MSHIVEFVGGPLDGFRHLYQFSPEELASTVGFEINPGFLDALIERNEVQDPVGEITSVAVYWLETGHETLRYHHLCSVAAEDCQLEDA